jgi:hypothetical protein
MSTVQSCAATGVAMMVEKPRGTANTKKQNKNKNFTPCALPINEDGKVIRSPHLLKCFYSSVLQELPCDLTINNQTQNSIVYTLNHNFFDVFIAI